jgi:hypothetical protein
VMRERGEFVIRIDMKRTAVETWGCVFQRVGLVGILGNFGLCWSLGDSVCNR